MRVARAARDVIGGEIGEGHCGAERSARAGIGAGKNRPGDIADGVESWNRPIVLAQNAGVGIDLEAALGTEIAQLDTDGIERRAIERSYKRWRL